MAAIKSNTDAQHCDEVSHIPIDHIQDMKRPLPYREDIHPATFRFPPVFHLWGAVCPVLVMMMFAQPAITQTYPKAPKIPVTDTIFGKIVTDEYRWMEDMNSSQTLDWLRAQAALTDDVLKKLPGREALLADFKTFDTLSRMDISLVRRRGERYFYKKTLAGENEGKLYYRNGRGGNELLLFDPKTWGEGKKTITFSYEPGHDGSKIALSLNDGTNNDINRIKVVGAGPAQDNVARMEQVLQFYVSNKQFMGSVLVARDKNVLLSKGYGFANLEWEIPNSSSTKFRLGSLTKQFTAACILLLEERGKLKIDDPVKKYLPDAPAAWDKVTIFHLLTHTSGIPSFTGFPDYASTEGIPSPVEKTVARFRDKPLDFQPGEKWSYSNSGYVLLGYLIEKISGRSYSDFVHENIFTPLGMKDSGYDLNSTIIRHRAAGYSPSPDGPVNAGFIHMSIPHAAGALYSTTEDLLRWEEALFGGKLLSAASLERMTTPFKRDNAFGLIVGSANGRKMIGHGGGIEGFNTFLAEYPDEKLTVVVLANLNGPAYEEIAGKLGAIAHGEEVQLPSERKEVAISPEVLREYVGTYQLYPDFDIVMTLEGDQLMTQITGQPKFPLFAESENKFFLRVVDAQVEFIKNEKGTVTHLVLHQGVRDMKAERK